MDDRKFIPSMFQRRLVLLAGVCVMIMFVLGAQMYRLAVVEGAERRASAESRLIHRTYLPTYRGRILDRFGRVLAVDRASYNIAVAYDVITGDWVHDQAKIRAMRDVGRLRWREMNPQDREGLINSFVPALQAHREELWQAICHLGKMSRSDLQEQLDEIKATVQSTAASVWERQRQRKREQLEVKPDENFDFNPGPIREQARSHVILRKVPDEVAFEFRRLSEEWPGIIEVQDSRRREYPWLSAQVPLTHRTVPSPIRQDDSLTIQVVGTADHILGDVRNEIWEEDVNRRPFRNSETGEIDLGWYKQGDIVGSRGLERVFEDHLRGFRGVIHERRDTAERSRTDPIPGHDLLLTLDIALQARVQAILSPEFGLTRVQPWHKNAALPLGAPLNSAAVIIEVETGDVLAMVSMPTIAMGEAMSGEQQKLAAFMVNRPVEAVYPPGSIVKPLVLAAAVQEGVHSLDVPIQCTGHYFPHAENMARCWIYRERFGFQSHSELLAEEALARSCNIFFYSLGDRLGMEKLITWYRKLGVGSPLDIGLRYSIEDSEREEVWIGESGGQIPGEEDIVALRARGELKFNKVIMGIGQGPVAWTPLHAANAYAILARGGIVRGPSLLHNDPRGGKESVDLNLNPAVIDAALNGLRGSVAESFGTSNHLTLDDGVQEPIFNATDVKVWGKTGTAQADKSKGFDHAWFVGLVGPRELGKPLYAIAVIIENGGSGGRTAGPIANQLIRALQTEGYLPGDPMAIASVN